MSATLTDRLAGAGQPALVGPGRRVFICPNCGEVSPTSLLSRVHRTSHRIPELELAA